MLLWQYGLGLLIGTTLCFTILLGQRFHVPGASSAAVALHFMGAFVLFFDLWLTVTGRLKAAEKRIPVYRLVYAAGITAIFIFGVAIPEGWLAV